MRVLCAGHVNWDVTLLVESLPDPDGEVLVEERAQAGGGSAANVACTLSSLDVQASLFGSVGDDPEGGHAQEELDASGVDTSNVITIRGHETTTKYLVVDGVGEVMVLSNEGVNEAFTPDDLDPGVLDSVDHLHLTSQRPATAVSLAELAGQRGTAVSFDPGRRIASRDYSTTLEHTDVLFLNEREADALADGDLTALPRRFRETVVVVKHGGRGATVYAPDGEYYHPGYDIEPVDTTGAGDAFAAGFIAARPDGTRGDGTRADGYDRSLAVANACGALAALEIGARANPTWADVERVLDGR